MQKRRFSFFRMRGAASAAAIILCFGGSAIAQMALPGSIAPAEEGAVAPQAQASKSGKSIRRGGEADAEGRRPAIAPKLPTDDAILGKTLTLDGSRGGVEFQRVGDRIEVARLTLTGDRISRSGEACRVEVSGTPLALQAKESDSGLKAYQIVFPACPFSFEVLDGAVLVATSGGACELKAADCRADPAGLWGMSESEFDAKRSKDMFSQRARVEKTVRNDFRVLYEKYKKDIDLRKQIVREQAGFSSLREEICRNYAQESDFGYCALRITEARALTLATQLAKGVKRKSPEAAVAEVKSKGKARGR